MKRDNGYSLVVVLLCIFAVSVILNIGLITKEITVSKNCDCEVNNARYINVPK